MADTVAAKKVDHKAIVEKLNELPTLPTIVYELSQAINNPMSSTKTVEKLMEKDQSLTAKVLRLANSAYYAIPGGVSTLARAIGFLGFDTVNQLVLSASIIKSLKVQGPSKFDLNQFWVHAMGVAMAAETIGKHLKLRSPTDIFTAGLVHDIGKVALCIVDPEVVAQASTHATTNNTSYFEAETKLGFPSHTNIGQILTKKWNLPMSIQYVVMYHHQMDAAKRTGCTADINKSIDIVFLANTLINNLQFGNSGHSKIQDPAPEVMDRLGLKAEDMPPLIEAIKKNLESADGFLKVIQG
jgi:HD-like signal output (HDOD) protein